MLDEEVAGAVTKVLRGVFEKSYATAYGSGPSNGQQVAGKTGTGVDYRDHWLVGYSPTLTCAAWIGNRDYSSTSEYLTANSLWHDFMTMALADTTPTPFPTVATPKYTNSQSEWGYSSSVTDQSVNQANTTNTEVANEVASYQAGSLTEDEVLSMYPAYELHITYQYSDVYPAGAVISESIDTTGTAINVVVSQGPKP